MHHPPSFLSFDCSGYVVDFGEVKKAMRRICHELDEHFLLPSRNPYLKVAIGARGNVEIEANDGSHFSFPEKDVIVLPICNVSVEELAQHICHRFVAAVTAQELRRHSIVAVTVGVAETANQEARFSVVVSAAGSSAPDSGSAGHSIDEQPQLPHVALHTFSRVGATSPRQPDSAPSFTSMPTSNSSCMPGTPSDLV